MKYVSLPKLIKYPVFNSFAYGHLYLPCNPDFCGIKGTLPPLIVHVHGGPTGAAFTNLNLTIQYWTSRGFAFFDVDYRGSTGYGKQYRHSLKVLIFLVNFIKTITILIIGQLGCI